MRVLEADTYHTNDATIFAVDIEKAFDSLEWAFLFHVMRTMGLGSDFLSWTALLYADSTARDGGLISDACGVGRGKRQGCPLSLLLFALAMEPLAAQARSGRAYRGIDIHGQVHYRALYADDLLLFLADAESELRGANRLLHAFSKVAGLKVNWSKSCLFPARRGRVGLQISEGVTWEDRCLPYLGTQIYHSQEDILEGNIGKAIRGAKSNFEFWGSLPLSVAGRVALLKMITLPRLLYYFRTLSVWIPTKFFKQLRSMISAFIWGTGRRVALSTLMRPRAEGGLAVPDYETYYLAAQFQWLTQWVADAIRVDDEHREDIRALSLLFRIVLRLPVNAASLTLELNTARKCCNRYL